MLPQNFFGFISSEIASGVILNMFALFVTLLFWYSRSRRGASARSPYVRFIVVCQAVETRAAHVYNRVWCNFFLMLTRLVRDYIQSCEEGRCCVHWIRGGGGNGPCVPPPPPLDPRLFVLYIYNTHLPKAGDRRLLHSVSNASVF